MDCRITQSIPITAFWNGPPSKQRQRELERDFFYDEDNDWGGGHGVLYHRNQHPRDIAKPEDRWIIFREFAAPTVTG